MNGGRTHGPYWYEYWREGARTRKRYWGRRRPSPRDFAEDETRDRGRYDRGRMRMAHDRGLLGLGDVYTSTELRRAYRRASFETHPDRGGNAARFRMVQIAYANLRALLR